MNRILEGLEGVVCLIDDVLVFASSQEEHDRRLAAVLQRLKEAGNRVKCEFNKRSIKFLGHIIDKDGICADPDKTAAVSSMDPCRIYIGSWV